MFSGTPLSELSSRVCHSLMCGEPDALYPHPTYCTQYVHCISGVPYVKVRARKTKREGKMRCKGREERERMTVMKDNMGLDVYSYDRGRGNITQEEGKIIRLRDIFCGDL